MERFLFPLHNFWNIWNIFWTLFHTKNKNYKASFRTFEESSRSKVYYIMLFWLFSNQNANIVALNFLVDSYGGFSFFQNLWNYQRSETMYLIYLVFDDMIFWFLNVCKVHSNRHNTSFVHLDQRPMRRCGPRAPKQQRPRGTQRPFGRCCCFGPR